MNPERPKAYPITEDMKFPVEWIAPMTIPNMGAILHIMLASEGYYNAKILGNKLAICLRNLAETSKKMWHFDFGMRAAKATCAIAGYTIQKDPSLEEHLALSIATYKNFGPKFPEEDRDALAAHITTTFVGPDKQAKAVVQNYCLAR